MTREEFIRRELAEHKRDIFWTRLVIVTAVLLVLAFVAYAVHAATVPSYTVSLYKSTTKVRDISADTEASAWSQCFDQAKALQTSTTSKVTCKTPVLSLVTVPDPPPVPTPPPVTPPIGTPTSVTLTWTPPTQNTNGSAYTDPFGYVINYGNSPDQLTQSIDVNDPKATTYVVQGLTAGQWFFCMRSRNTSNVRSDCSNVVSKTL